MANIAVLYGSVRSSRRGIGLAKWLVKKINEMGHEATLIDPMKDKLPLLDKMYSEYEKAPETMEKIAKILREADGYLIVSAEYNHSIPPALKNLIDHYMKEYFFKPSGLVTYSKGPFAGVRNIHNLRAIMGEVGTVSIPSIFSVSNIGESFDVNGKILDENYDRRSKKFFDEFFWYIKALKKAREKGTPY